MQPLAKITEIFSSVQGEGPYVGIPQLFIRFSGCMMRCRFCDTVTDEYTLWDPQQLFEQVRGYDSPFHSICLTGGEPLLYREFLTQFLPRVKEERIPVYLETNGILWRALSDILALVDIIAADIKLPSSTGEKPYWDEHRRFLHQACARELFVKVIICQSTSEEDVVRAAELVSGLLRHVPFILQPNTDELRGPGFVEKIESLRMRAAGVLSDVRIIPQVHKMLAVK